MENNIKKACKNIPKKYYSGIDKKDIVNQCNEIKKSRKNYKKQKYFTRKKIKSYKHKPSRHVIDFKKKYCIDMGNLKKIQEITGVPIRASKEVLKRGRGAYLSNGSRPNQTPESWARARLASFILKRGAYIRDKDIWNKYNIDSKIKSGRKCSKKTQKGGIHYEGTSEKRLKTIHKNLKSIPEKSLIDRWENIRIKLLNAGGLKILPETQHIFNDFNHCDLTPMKKSTFENKNNDKVEGIDTVNYLGNVIRKCSINSDGFTDNDGSWGTCMIGCNQNPPQDVAHLQFNSKIAFKLIWLPPNYDDFIIVDDNGNILKKGTNLDKNIPDKNQRIMNFQAVEGPISKYTKNI